MVGFMKSVKNIFGIKDSGSGAGGGGTSLDEFLGDLPQLLGYDVRFKKIDSEEPGVHFEVEGEELDSFLGPNCEMLDALAHLSMRVLRKNEGLANAPAEEGENVFRVTFDAQGFRSGKSQELKDLATSQRLKVIESGGKPAYIKALGPSERKIIHTTLADLGEVTSESIGRGNFKRIRIKLKDDSTHRREQPEGSTEEGAPRSAEGGNGFGGQPRGPREGGGGGGGNRGGRGGRGARGGRGGGNGGGGGGGQQARGGQQQQRSAGGGGGRGPRNDGFGNGGGRGPRRDPAEGGNEVNGNTVRPERPADYVDDNIGNRLKPGETPIFNYNGDNN